MESSVAVFLMKTTHVDSLSTEITSLQFRETSSKLMLPVPQKRSRQRNELKSYLLSSMLNKAVLAISVVGLTGRPRGGRIARPLYFPLMMRKSADRKC